MGYRETSTKQLQFLLSFWTRLELAVALSLPFVLSSWINYGSSKVIETLARKEMAGYQERNRSDSKGEPVRIVVK